MDIISFPIDTIKTRIQVDLCDQASVGKKLDSSIKQADKKNLYRGLSSNVIISFPSAFCYFLGYDTTRRYLTCNHGDWMNENAINILGGVGAEITANTVRTPFEIVKQQMQIGLDTNLRDTFKNIYKARGFRGKTG